MKSFVVSKLHWEVFKKELFQQSSNGPEPGSSAHLVFLTQALKRWRQTDRQMDPKLARVLK